MKKDLKFLAEDFSIAHRLCFTVVALVLLLGLFSDEYKQEFIAGALYFSAFAAAVNFCWGIAGVANLGAGVYFGLGAYGIALLLKTDFPATAIIGVMGLSILGGCAFSAFAIGGLSGGVKHGVVSIALALAVEQVAISAYSFTGGSNGIAGVSRGSLPPLIQGGTGFLVLSCFASLALVGGLMALKRCEFGKILTLARDSPTILGASGVRPIAPVLVAVFVMIFFSMLCGAGYVLSNGIAHPGLLGLNPGIVAIIWSAIAGRGYILITFSVGLVFKLVEFELGSVIPNYHMLFLGVVMLYLIWQFPSGFGFLIKKTKAR